MTDVISKTPSSEDEVKLLRLKEVMYRCGISRSLIYVLMSRDEFPKQFRIGERAVAWDSREIDEWIMSRRNRTL